jgi:hypothetical protein
MPDGIVHTCVTSPPYFGLRDYGHAGQIGLEETPEQFVAKLVEVFREVRRVLRDDGTLLGEHGRQLRWIMAAQATTDKTGKTRLSRPNRARHERRRNRQTRVAGSCAGLKAEGPDRHPLDAGLRPARRRLVSAPGHHLEQAEPDARERHRPLHQGPRVPLPAGEVSRATTSTRNPSQNPSPPPP